MIIGGIFSCVVSSQADTWWSKVISYGNPQVARIINQTSAPLLISDSFTINYGNVFSLSYLTEPKVRFMLVKDKTIPKIPDSFSDVFLLNPSKTWRTGLEQKYKSKTVTVYSDNKYSLWKLAKPRTSRQSNIQPRKKLPE
ncbi:MAG: hypothetical protein ACHBN1_36965 [Heteroscytonema crispum UTEX LB 1556]